MRSRCTDHFWSLYEALPPDVKDKADKAYRLWMLDPRHGAVMFKKLNAQRQAVWEERVGPDYRAMCVEDGQGGFVWFWIDSKQEAKSLY